jgi:hypothetical protein
MGLTKEQIEKLQRVAVARAEKKIVKLLQRLVDSTDVAVTVCRPTELPVWVLELNPPPAGTARHISYRTTEKARRGK